MVPFIDLKRSHEGLKQSFVKSFESILERSAFINGSEVAIFETAFADYVGTQHCLGTCSGLSAEVIGLRALNLPEDAVVVAPAMTFIATTEAITQAGYDIALVDVDETGLMDLDAAEKELKNGARCLLPVHLFGQLVDAPRLDSLRKKYGVKVFEDACQAHGATDGTWHAGGIGDASAFSFYPGKNLGGLGDAGALCTNDPNVHEIAKALREHGQIRKNEFAYEGYTARLDTVQAAFLSIKLPHLQDWTKLRILAARRYAEGLGQLAHGRLQAQIFDGRHVYHLMVLLTERRAQLAEALKDQGIGFGFHYPVAINQMACYANKPWHDKKFANAEIFAAQSISLPIFPGITPQEIDSVIQVVRSVCG